MKVAITVWEDRISPVFDASHMLLITAIVNSMAMSRNYMTFDPERISCLTEALTQFEIRALICGAISEIPANAIEARGIELIPFISGNVDKVLGSYAKNLSLEASFLMPGCRGLRRSKRKRHTVCLAHGKGMHNLHAWPLKHGL